MKRNTKNDADTVSTAKQDNSVNESDSNKMRKARRRLIQILVAGGVVVTAKSVPGSWSRPVVNAVTLPAHARTSGELIRLGNASSFVTGSTLDLEQSESLLASGIEQSWDAIMDTLVEGAYATDTLCALSGCCYIEYRSGDNSGKLVMYLADLVSDSAFPEKLDFNFTNGQEGSFNDTCLMPGITFIVTLISDTSAKLQITRPSMKPFEIDLVENYSTCVADQAADT